MFALDKRLGENEINILGRNLFFILLDKELHYFFKLKEKTELLGELKYLLLSNYIIRHECLFRHLKIFLRRFT